MTRRSLFIPLVVLLLWGGASPLAAQHPPIDSAGRTQPEIVDGVDYRVYDRAGRPTSLEAIVQASHGEDVLLVGEEHDDMIGHAFETAIFRAVLDGIGGPAAAGRQVVLSLEMFESDVQYVVDEYLTDLISEEHFLKSSRPWDDYDIRYRPAVEAAKEAGAPVVAANAPRRYVNRVSSEGPESLTDLSEQARSYLPPLPYPGPSAEYRAQWDALMAEAMGDGEDAGDDTPSHGVGAPVDSIGAAAPDDEEGGQSEAEPMPRPYAMSPNVIQAQALWDASMGHSITEALVRHVGGFVVHFAGSFHVAEGTGIPERITDYRPGTRVVTVVMTKVDDVDAWSAEDHGKLGDYVVLTRKPGEPSAAGS